MIFDCIVVVVAVADYCDLIRCVQCYYFDCYIVFDGVYSAHQYSRLDSLVSFHDLRYTFRCHRRAPDDNIASMAMRQCRTI